MQNLYIGTKPRKTGMMPGSLVFTGKRKMKNVSLEAFFYNQEEVRRSPLRSADEIPGLLKEDCRLWLNINGLHDSELIRRIGEIFGINPLFLEDILNTGQRPKAELGEDYMFYVLKMIRLAPKEDHLNIEQLSMIHGRNYLLTFQEVEGDLFDAVRQRLMKNIGRLRRAGTDYLAYALMDTVVDHYIVILDHLRDLLEPLDTEALDSNERRDLPSSVRSGKNQLILLRRFISPLREVLDTLQRDGDDLWDESMTPYLNDLRDHLRSVMDTIESYRENLSGVLELHLAVLSQKMNDVMRTLTVIATIFIPLTFAAGIYGMNFEFMPELKMRWGYYGFWGFCAAVALLMLAAFRWKKWL